MSGVEGWDKAISLLSQLLAELLQKTEPTDVQLVSASSLPLPAGSATAAKQDTGNASLASLDTKTVAVNTGAVTVAASALPTGAATETTLAALNTKVTAVNTGAVIISSGNLTDAGSGKTLKTAAFSLSATGTVIPAVSTKRLKVYAVKLLVSAAITVSFRDGASTSLEGAQVLSGGYIEVINPPSFLFASTAGNSIDLVIVGVGTAAGRVSYWDDDTT